MNSEVSACYWPARYLNTCITSIAVLKPHLSAEENISRDVVRRNRDFLFEGLSWAVVNHSFGKYDLVI